ncbi:hypothetical protein COT48_03025 [Candidatus Woesearchaeota archaeon CG08_land_8_20_14_0_20_47_9]|nr:MAG: hypothetical protein COT48_03025 [Candidatus Woesearchaeota archaeon CG08_land_8_20_14_0_20_47_9]
MKRGFLRSSVARAGSGLTSLVAWLDSMGVSRRVLFIALVIVLGLVFMGSLTKRLLFVLLFLFLSSISMIYNRSINVSLGFEFVTFGTIMCGIVYGPGTAIFVGLIGIFLAEYVGGRMQPHTIISFIGMGFIGFIAHFFAGMDIRLAGILLVIIYDAIICPLYLIYGSEPARVALYMVTHWIFNFWLFIAVSRFVAGVMG